MLQHLSLWPGCPWLPSSCAVKQRSDGCSKCQLVAAAACSGDRSAGLVCAELHDLGHGRSGAWRSRSTTSLQAQLQPHSQGAKSQGFQPSIKMMQVGNIGGQTCPTKIPGRGFQGFAHFPPAVRLFLLQLGKMIFPESIIQGHVHPGQAFHVDGMRRWLVLCRSCKCLMNKLSLQFFQNDSWLIPDGQPLGSQI